MTKCLALIIFGLLLVPLVAADNNVVQTFPGPDGRLIAKVVVPGIPVEKRIPGPVAVPSRNAVMLNEVPAFDWSYGCSATSAAMMAAYYDRLNFGHIYSGPTNGGVMPLTNASWGDGECPLSATHQGYDGLATAGHVDRFWTDSSGSDPFGTGDPTATYFGCTADYMGTNQDWWGNSDGSTTFYYYVDGSALYDPQDGTTGPPYGRDGIHGLRLFFESRGYSVNTNFNQYILGWDGNTSGYTYDQYKASIDAGIPVMIQIEDHSMVGIGYESNSSTIYIRNTWDYETRSMTWGGSYSGLAQYGVGVIQLNQPPSISVSDNSLYAALLPGAVGTDSFTISNSGTGPLFYSLDQVELLSPAIDSQNPLSTKDQDRSIAGSSLSLDTSEYSPGTTLNWSFALFNGSTDDEWLKYVYITFPAGVLVNSASNFIGGGGGDLIPDLTSGDGITICWAVADPTGWGTVYAGNTAVATVNVTIMTTFTGTLSLPYQIDGDNYGADPHVLNGAIDLTQAVPPISWFRPLPLSGVVSAGSSQVITGHFSAVDMTPGTYTAQITLHSNDPYTPSQIVSVTMDVLGANPPVISSISKTASGVSLVWNASPGATLYKVYWTLDPKGSFNFLGSTSLTSYVDTEANNRAFYRVTAVYGTP